MNSSDKSPTSMPVSMGAHLLSSTNNQASQVDLLPRFHSPIPINMLPHQLPASDGRLPQGRFQTSLSGNHGYHLAFSNAQSTQMALLPNLQGSAAFYVGYQQLPSTGTFPSGNESSPGAQNSMSVNAGQQISSSKKRPLQREPTTKFQRTMSINQGSQMLSSTNPRSPQTEPQAKAQTEAFESVRSKLRESLAASLTLVPDQHKPQVAKSSLDAESITGQGEEARTSAGLGSMTSNAPCGNSPETLTSKYDEKGNEIQDVTSETSPNRNSDNHAEVCKTDVQGHQATHASLENEVPFRDNRIISDELLQGHGLCWASDVDAENSEPVMNQAAKRSKLLHEESTDVPEKLHQEVTGESKEDKELLKAESIAIKIEAELFRLFGGVNKKYKEKARSLLFNLKDRNNPELRERVLSADIAPERLCTMTAEELASKELSEWRLAKAEELAHMVVLPDSEVDIRRLVKKTHKGEFQVEVEQVDSVSVEVAAGESSSSRPPAKNSGVKTKLKSGVIEALSKHYETKATEDLFSPEKGDSGDQNESSNLDTLLNEKTDLMQDLMVDELKDTECLPPIVSLDEFMQALDLEPPFDNLSLGADIAKGNSESLQPKMDRESDGLEPSLSDTAPRNLSSKEDPSKDNSRLRFSPAETDFIDPEEIVTDGMGKEDNIHARSDGDLKSGSLHVEPVTCLSNAESRSDNIWEGIIQLNISALASVVGFFRSGEKTSTEEWPSFLEVKGRVRLDAFEKFLQELRLSRSRGIMIAQFCWKEGSHDGGLVNISETANSYIADQRVGFAEPAPGVELYFCPPHPKMTEMLEMHLPKEHTLALHSSINGLVGVVVWRRPHVTTISPKMSSHHKHGSKKRSSSKQQQQNVINSSSSSRPSTYQKSQPDDDEPIADVPPGFGPASGRDEDDLPEFDFNRCNNNNNTAQLRRAAGMMTSPHAPLLPSHSQARPVEQMRELILKYGKGDGGNEQCWNNGDDPPEWKPNQNNQLLQPQQLPPPPPPPLPPQLQPQQPHNYQQQAVMGSQLVLPTPTAQQQQQQQQQQMMMMMPLAFSTPMPMQAQLNPQMLMMMQGQQNVNAGWQQGPVWAPAQGQPPQVGGMMVNFPVNGVMQPCHFGGQQPGGDGQFYGVPAFGAAGQNGMAWMPDVPR